MGVYLNPGNDMFQTAINSEIYVDKTELIRITNKVLGTMQKFVCISRPRRFGKLMAAYYGKDCDSSEQFAPYKIAKCESYKKYLNKYNVIMLNIQDFLSMTSSVEEMLLNRLYGKRKEAFVFIIDEWDCILRDKSYNADDQKKYADSLKDYKGNLILVGINYDKKTKKHDCMIEKMEK